MPSLIQGLYGAPFGLNMAQELITWLASYPKSGNTWLRLFLTAYKQGGYVDINENVYTTGDSLAHFTRAVSPLPLENLGTRGKLLLRPAALLHQISASVPRPLFVKTHHINGQVDSLPALIPTDLTERAIYLVRDPRDIATSFARHMNKTVDETIALMNKPDNGLESTENMPQCLNTWSTHVKSWTMDLPYPTLVVRYEDLIYNPHAWFSSILDFCGIPVDASRVNRSIEACNLENLRTQELKNGFKERKREDQIFFGAGGSRWVDELMPYQSHQIEEDHGEAMESMGYTVFGYRL